MSSVQIIRYVASNFQTNVYLVFDVKTKDAFIVDPAADFNDIHEDIKKYGLHPCYMILTHGHGDHTGGILSMYDNYDDIKLVASEKEKNFLFDKKASRGKGGYVADIQVKDGDELMVGNMKLKFISTPGHTPGGMCILLEDKLFSGDTLFFGSVGRTDLVGGNTETLIQSIKEKLMVLPDDTIVYPGHSKETSIGFERNYNPFV